MDLRMDYFFRNVFVGFCLDLLMVVIVLVVMLSLCVVLLLCVFLLQLMLPSFRLPYSPCLNYLSSVFFISISIYFSFLLFSFLGGIPLS